jgi:hypothetical protein
MRQSRHNTDINQTERKFTWIDSMRLLQHVLLLLSYALGVRKLINVHHRAGYPKNSMKEKDTQHM